MPHGEQTLSARVEINNCELLASFDIRLKLNPTQPQDLESIIN